MTSDWKALQHIYNNSNTFIRQTQSREIFRMVAGPGLPVVHGDDHKRQRKVMQPAFGAPQLKALFPVFSRHTGNVSHPCLTCFYAYLTIVNVAYLSDGKRHQFWNWSWNSQAERSRLRSESYLGHHRRWFVALLPNSDQVS